MRFEVLFDIVEAGYFFPWGPFFFPFIFSGAAFLFKAAAVLFPDSPHVRFLPFFAIGLGILSVFLAIGEFRRTEREHMAMSKRYLAGRYETVEGHVRNLTRKRVAKPPVESFDVAHRHFKYALDRYFPGFDGSRSKGGPLVEGMFVRIAHIDGLIVRLEAIR